MKILLINGSPNEHGFTAEDARKDAEGMQTMRTLGQNIAFLVKASAAAKENGVPAPIYEEKTFTNFIV